MNLKQFYEKNKKYFILSGWDSSVGTATPYGLGSSRIESRWGQDFPHPSRLALGPNQSPVQLVPCFAPGGKLAGAWRWPLAPSWVFMASSRENLTFTFTFVSLLVHYKSYFFNYINCCLPSFQLYTINLLRLHILIHLFSVCSFVSFFLTLRNLFFYSIFILSTAYIRWSQWPRGLRRETVAARMLGLRVRIPPGHGRPSVFNAVCCQLEVSASGWSLVQRSPTECGVPEWDHEASVMLKPWSTWDCRAMTKQRIYSFNFTYFPVRKNGRAWTVYVQFYFAKMWIINLSWIGNVVWY